MEFLKEIKSSLLIMSGFYIIIGLVMLIAPTFVSNSICYLIGALCFIIGGLAIYTYIASEVYGTLGAALLIVAVLFIGVGIFIVLNPEFFASFIPIIMGVILVVDAFGKMQSSMTLKKYGYDYWWQVIAAAGVIFVFGILLLFNPFGSLLVLIRILGLFLVVDGFANLLTVMSYAKIEKAIK